MVNPERSLPECLLITGASGLVGRALVGQLQREFPNVELRGLSRRPHRHGLDGVRMFAWNPDDHTLDPEALDGVGAIFHLAGETVAQRWTPEVRRRIRSSRIAGLGLLRDHCDRLGLHPRLVSASAIGWYPDSPEALDETAPCGPGFLSEIVRDWEEAAAEFGALGGGHASLRIGLVLAAGGGVLGRLSPLYRWGLGSPLAPGTQWQSWVHIEDLVSLFLHAMGHTDWSGAYNAVAPESVPQAEFSRTLARVMRRPHVLPAVPQFALKLLFGEAAQALLASNRIVPARTEASGFAFRHPQLAEALTDLLR